MHRDHDFMRLSIFILSAVPLAALAAETPIITPSNMAIICVPGYSNNLIPKISENNSPARLLTIGENVHGLIPFTPGFLFKPPLFISGHFPKAPEIRISSGYKQQVDGAASSDAKSITREKMVPSVNFIANNIATAFSIIIHEINNQIAVILKSINNAIKTITKTADDILATYINTWEYIVLQSELSVEYMAEEGPVAITNFAASESLDQYETLQNSADQLKQGIIIDVLWSHGVNPISAFAKNFIAATHQNMILEMAAAYIAPFYAGPAGPTAFAAWKTIQLTGDVNLAYRMGLVAVAPQRGGALVVEIPTEVISEVAKEAAVEGVNAGVAVATAGADETVNPDASTKPSGNAIGQDTLE